MVTGRDERAAPSIPPPGSRVHFGPPLPEYGWDLFELIDDPRLLRNCYPSAPHWTPRGGRVSATPPTDFEMQKAGLQGRGRVVAVRYRIEPETAFFVSYDNDDGPEPVPAADPRGEQLALFP